MTTINRLTLADPIAVGDLLALWSTANGDTRKASLTDLIAFLLQQMNLAVSPAPQYAAPDATGFSVTVAPAVEGGSVWLLLKPTSGFAAGTIVLPLDPVDRQEVLVSITQPVTALTVSGNGKTVNGAPTTAAANAFFRLRFDTVEGAWYRIG